MARVTARAAVMQMIFERLEGGQGGEDTLRMVYEQLREDGLPGVSVREGEPEADDRAYIERVLEGVLSHLDELDEQIQSASRNWTIDRMPHVDLTILRLAVWEILHEDEVPGPVAINEAVTLAGCYSEPASGRFINGVLGTILRRKEGRA